MYNWSEDWQMLFNPDKCKIMHFGYNNPNNIFQLGGHILETVDEEKDFGVMIRKDLKASSQCIKIVKTANQILGMIIRTFTFKTKDNLLQLYKCLVRPHLEYWIIFGWSWCSHVTPILRKRQHWLSAPLRIEFNIAKLVYKALINLAPDYIDGQSTITDQRRSTLRSVDEGILIMPKTVTEFGKRSPAFVGTHLWKNLSINVRQSSSIHILKKRLITFLFDKSFRD